MSKAPHTPMDQDAASRIARATALKHGGKIPADEFAGRADAAMQRRQIESQHPPKPAASKKR